MPYDQTASGAIIYAHVNGNPVNAIDPFGLEKMIFFSPIRDLTAYLGSMRDPDKSGILTIYAHGGPNAVNGPSLINRFGDRLNANQLADLIRGKVENGKTPVWLKACDTGEDPEGFAQQLANRAVGTILGA